MHTEYRGVSELGGHGLVLGYATATFSFALSVLLSYFSTPLTSTSNRRLRNVEFIPTTFGGSEYTLLRPFADARVAPGEIWAMVKRTKSAPQRSLALTTPSPLTAGRRAANAPVSESKPCPRLKPFPRRMGIVAKTQLSKPAIKRLCRRGGAPPPPHPSRPLFLYSILEPDSHNTSMI